MPRLARLDAPGVLHHVMGRGIERKKIFRNNKDRRDFIEGLAALVEKGAMDIYGWTLIPNHFHKYVLSFFGSGSNARRNYVRYVERGVGLGQRPELAGGGLIRSLGGWSEVLALRKRGEKQASDTRILGDSEFVKGVTSHLDDLVKKNLRLSRGQVDMVTH